MKFVIPFVLASLTLTAASDEFNKARTLYYRGSDGDKTAYEQAAKLFDALHARNPTDPRIEVYTGSLRLWEAAHTWALWKKNTLSKEGIAMIDSAVEADPQSLEVRFVRAVTDYSLPSFFHRRKQSDQDFTRLAAHAPIAASDGKLEPRLAAASLYFHGLFLRESSQDEAAKDAWREAISVAPDSRAARDSAEELKKLAH
jgi:tetratricopeptide (TPR) repeat protein